MAYTDGRVLIRSKSTAEGASPAALAVMGGDTVGSTTYGEEIIFPDGAVIDEFGMVVQVTLGTQGTAAPVASLKTIPRAGGATATEVATITPSASTAAGTRVLSTDTSFPLIVPPGGGITFNVKTAGNADTGDYFLYVYARNGGSLESTTDSPTATKAT